jgi:hypothetical protein
MFDQVDSESMDYFCKKTVENEKILESNGKLWTTALDMQLKEFVILYNFNFYDIASRFHNFISEKKRYDFTEDEIRRHWAFIHAARYLNITVDEDYYQRMSTKYKVEEIRKKKITPEEEKNKELEEKKIQKEIEKMRYERFNLITVPNPDDEIKNKEKLEGNLNIENSGESGQQGKRMEIMEVSPEQDQNETENNQQKIILEKSQSTTNDKESNKLKINISETNENENLPGEKNLEEDDEVINNLFQSVHDKNHIHKNEDSELRNFTSDNYNINDETPQYEESLFPISTKQNFFISENKKLGPNGEIDPDDIPQGQENPNDNSVDEDLYRSLKEKYAYGGFDKEIEKTKTIDDFIKEDDKLREQYDNLNTYYNFAVKSLNYFIPKLGKGLEGDGQTAENEISSLPVLENEQSEGDVDQFESKVIQKTSEKINDLFLNSVRKINN